MDGIYSSFYRYQKLDVKKHQLAEKSQFLRRVFEMADFGQSAMGDPLQNSQNRPSYHLGMISNLPVSAKLTILFIRILERRVIKFLGKSECAGGIPQSHCFTKLLVTLDFQSTKALHATAEALDDRQKVLEEFEGLRVSHVD